MATTFTSHYAAASSGAWVTLAEAPASYPEIIRHLICTNTGSTDCTLQVRITDDGDVEQSQFVNDYIVDPAVPLNMHPAFIVLDAGYKLQVKFNTNDASASAWGGYDTD